MLPLVVEYIKRVKDCMKGFCNNDYWGPYGLIKKAFYRVV